MLKQFIFLEWRSFTRAASFKANLAIKILMGLGALYMIGVFTALGIGLFYLLEDQGFEPLATVNRFLIFYLVLDLLIRFFLQKLPVMNIRPLLCLNISKNSMVSFTLGKTALSFFNWSHLFFLVPFIVILVMEGYDPAGSIAWFFAVYALIFTNNFLNILSDNYKYLLYSLGILVLAFALLQYYHIFDVTVYVQPIFDAFLNSPFLVIFPLLIMVFTAAVTFMYFKRNLYLDAGLSVKQQDAKTENYTWLNQFGTLGTFLKNDIKLIRRNKRSRTTVVMSVLFIFYGLLFFSGAIEVYEGPVWRIFAGIFVTGGFMFTFGQFVPSWDSSYYPLMMSQNIQYREYLNAKWWLMVIATVITTILSSFYLYFGIEIYLAILAGAVYNIGVNSHMVLWAGAYIKTPIDLTQNKNAFGNKQAFNAKTLLLTLPKLVLPMILYAIGHFLFNPNVGYAIVVIAGIIGFAFKNKVFEKIENIYKSEKYKTIAAYKQTS
jgi:hypothetical protein